MKSDFFEEQLISWIDDFIDQEDKIILVLTSALHYHLEDCDFQIIPALYG